MDVRILTSEDVMPESDSMDWKGEILVLNIHSLKKEYKEAKFQLHMAVGGFGLKPGAGGSGVFAICLADNEHAKWHIGQFLGVAKPEVIAEVFPDGYNISLVDE